MRRTPAAEARRVLTLLATLVVALAAACRSPALPVLGTVPAFSFTERSGRPLTDADLRGRVWVASFIFTFFKGEETGINGYVDALYYTVTAVTTTGFGDIVLPGIWGKLVAIATTGAKRDPALPDLPTVAEAGVKGYESGVWFGIMVPAATPKDIIARLNAAAVRPPLTKW